MIVIQNSVAGEAGQVRMPAFTLRGSSFPILIRAIFELSSMRNLKRLGLSLQSNLINTDSRHLCASICS